MTPSRSQTGPILGPVSPGALRAGGGVRGGRTAGEGGAGSAAYGGFLKWEAEGEMEKLSGVAPLRVLGF